MTQQDDITQRALTDEQIRALILDKIGNVTQALREDAIEFARAIETAVLSQVRAPVAGEAQPTWDDLKSLAVKHSVWVPGYGPFAAELLATYGLAPAEQPHWLAAWLNAMNHAAPQASAEDVRNAALEEAAKEMDRLHAQNRRWHNEFREAAAVVRALKTQADKDGGQQRAGDAERWRWATATDENAQMLYTIVQAYGGDQQKINERADFYRAALSAPQAEQGERDAG